MRNKLVVQVKVAVLTGFSLILMFLPHFPLFPPAPFLKYDPSDIPALIGGFALGPWAGIAIVILKELLMLFYRFNPIHLLGVPMSIVAGCSLVGVSSWWYRWRGKNKRNAAIGLFFGTLVMAALMIPVNYLVFDTAMDLMNITPSFSVTYYVLAMSAPFNLIKGAVSSILAFLVYKRVSAILKDT